MDQKEETLARAAFAAIRQRAENRQDLVLTFDKAITITDYVDHLRARASEADRRTNRAERLAQGAPTHRHLKRGTLYREMARGLVQSAEPIHEGDELVAYIGEDGAAWFRPVAEFDDGRFAALPPGRYVDPRDVRIAALESAIRRLLASGAEVFGATQQDVNFAQALVDEAGDPWLRSDGWWDVNNPEYPHQSPEEALDEAPSGEIVEIEGYRYTGRRWGFSLPGLPGPEEDETRSFFYETEARAKAESERLLRELSDAHECVCAEGRPNRDCPVHGRDPDPQPAPGGAL